MNTIETTTLTTAQIREIEIRAHELRAQAFADLTGRLFRALFIAPFKLFFRPACARPLRG